MLRKDDPVYYKVKLQELLKQAIDNGLEIGLEMNKTSFIMSFISDIERASVKINKLEEGD